MSSLRETVSPSPRTTVVFENKPPLPPASSCGSVEWPFRQTAHVGQIQNEMAKTLLLVALLWLGVHASPPTAWTFSSSRAAPSPDSSEGDHQLLFDFDEFVRFLTTSARGNSARKQMVFPLPDGSEQTCELFPSLLFDPELAAKYPELLLHSGKCQGNNATVHFNLNTQVPTSFSLMLTIPTSTADFYYVDNVPNTSGYVLYAKSSRKNPGKQFNCGSVGDLNLEQGEGASGKRELLQTKSGGEYVGRTFRLAIATNVQYSKAMGDTKSLVLNAIAAVMSRVNGIYMRELGVYFQLIAKTDKLLCITGETNACTSLPNANADTIIRNAHLFMATRDVMYTEYDIGHVFTTASGGLAAVSVLCASTWKAAGTTGTPNPVGDSFAVDFVAHELGHQLGGYHSFRDCQGDNPDLSPEAAAEPGSGSSIMAYAGICNDKDLQLHSDAYLHPVNLEQMSQFISTQVINTGCGKDSTPAIKRKRPTVLTAKFTCQIPVGNYFYLTAQASEQATAFQWDEVDLGYQMYYNLNLPRFRSWKPFTTSSTRYFPNLYYLTHNLHNQAPYMYHEHLPSAATAMKFRFTARSVYQLDASNSAINELALGDFAFQDYTVQFTNTQQPLLFASNTRQLLSSGIVLNSSQEISFSWTGGAGQVEVLTAVNSMAVQVSDEAFDAALNILPLGWISLGKANSQDGQAILALPSFVKNVQVSFMLRPASPANGNCVSFDFISSTTMVLGRGGTGAPTLGMGDTNSPTNKPTRPITSAPTKRPTRTPTKKPTKRPTSKPTKRPTRTPTKWPTKRVTSKPTRRPTRTPTKRPTRRVTSKPTTKFPTKK
ncbi:hypothetical protein BASA81_007115 [Batrachochytrium salamandrivorans]|nr:hypothetical protein BASA81_007115 [Batrachochytrium salamandrivorans]